MRRKVLGAQVRLRLDDDPAQTLSVDHPHQPLPEERRRQLLRRDRELPARPAPTHATPPPPPPATSSTAPVPSMTRSSGDRPDDAVFTSTATTPAISRGPSPAKRNHRGSSPSASAPFTVPI